MSKSSKWFVFALVAVAQFMVVLDNSIVNVALKDVQQSLGFEQSSLQWIVTAYTLAFGGFLLLGGRMADLYGRRRILLTGLAGFTLFSLLTGLSVSPLMMIIMRGLQGLSAALMSPAALSTTLTLFTEPKERNRALGYWSLVSTAGGAIGLLLGGLLSQFIGWRWNFFINVPVGILLIIGLNRYASSFTTEKVDSKLDAPGAVLVTSGLMAIVLAISQAPEWGWTAISTLGVGALGVALLVAFVLNEQRQAHPLVPLHIFKVRNVVGANLMIMPLFATMFSQFFLLSIYLQEIMGYSPLLTGVAFLPFPLLIGILSPRVSGWVSRFGYKRFLLTGPWFIIAGLLWLTRLPVTSVYWIDLLPALILMPIGIGLTIMPILTAATAGVPKHESGLASGMVNTSQQIGGALGLSILTGLSTSVAAANGSLGQVAATVRGYNAAFMVAAGFILLAVVVAACVILEKRGVPTSTEPPVAEAV